MRIAIVTSDVHGGGAEFVLRRWTLELSRAGNQVVIYSYRPHVDQQPPDGALALRRFPYASRQARAMLLPFWLRRNAARDSVDVVLSMLTFSNLAASVAFGLSRGGPKLVLSERSLLTMKLRLERHSRLKRRLARLLYPRADSVVAISHPVAADLVGGYGVRPERVFVVPNPVVAATSTQSAAPVPPSELRVVYVGRLVMHKDPALYLQTLAELAARGISVSGLVIGDGPLRESLGQIARNLYVDVEFAGWQEPWWDAVPDVDCLLLPSRVEGFANVLVEAARAGIPAVAVSSALGVADAIVPGVTGALARGQAPGELADAVLEAVVDHGPGIEGWLDRFSARTSAEILAAVLCQVVGRPGEEACAA
jgi:glycosyltransferase involved in cell wall biosynthesis